MATDYFLLRAYHRRKPPWSAMFSMCARYKCPLMTQKKKICAARMRNAIQQSGQLAAKAGILFLRGFSKVCGCRKALAVKQQVANFFSRKLQSLPLATQVPCNVTWVKSACVRARRPIRAALISGFCSMKRQGILVFPLGWDASPSQGYPPALVSLSNYDSDANENVTQKTNFTFFKLLCYYPN